MTEPSDPLPPGDVPAPAAEDPRDRRRDDRRSGTDRRERTAPPAGVNRRTGDRRRSDRRAEPVVPDAYRGGVRQINEYPLDADELEFINAIHAYRQRHSRPFPTWSEVLHVLKFLGYRRVAEPGRVAAPPPAPPETDAP